MRITIARNTKRFKSATRSATGVTAYTLENYFTGQPATLDKYAIENGKLTHDAATNIYTLRLHDNCWYKWIAA